VTALEILGATAFTATLYWVCSAVQRRLRLSLLHPLLSSVLAGGTLLALLPPAWLDGYVRGSKPLLWLLGPATAALALAQVIHTQPGLTTVCVFTSGLVGSAIGPALLSRIGVRSPVARGLALGTLSHAIGTARALEEGPLPGAAGVVALTLSAMLIGAGAIALSLIFG